MRMRSVQRSYEQHCECTAEGTRGGLVLLKYRESERTLSHIHALARMDTRMRALKHACKCATHCFQRGVDLADEMPAGLIQHQVGAALFGRCLLEDSGRSTQQD